MRLATIEYILDILSATVDLGNIYKLLQVVLDATRSFLVNNHCVNTNALIEIAIPCGAVFCC